MTANSLFIVILAISFVASLALHTACVRWGLRWAKVADVTYTKALGLLFLFLIAGLLVALVVCAVLFGLSAAPSDQLLDIASYVCQFVASCLVIVLIYKASFLRAAQAIIPYILASAAMVLTAIYVIRPYTHEAYEIVANSMAPTLLGPHYEAPCPRCGQCAYGSPLDAGEPFSKEGVIMNCSAERQSVYVRDVPQEVFGADRILASKLISPQRWDLVVFRVPSDPAVVYVMRLVGLPNEKLAIHDGAVWINGEKLEPPKLLQGIQYSPTITEHGQVYSGPGSAPVQLGPDEYFVLGDFPERSADSRLWEQGAPGHPPYAVPESHLIGVVINIYWPPSRWTSFR